ncbi:MAG TPA: hypothetical protein VF836_04960 [Gemmatimonadaceae bacterium]
MGGGVESPPGTAAGYFPNRAIRVWTREMPDGKIEQYQIAPIG